MVAWILAAAAAAALLIGCARGKAPAPADAPVSPARQETVSAAPGAATPSGLIDFDSRIRPLLEERCGPCHFEGGKMYDQLPFDQADTIRELGTRLFTRIKDEKERALIRAFLDQPGS